VIEATGNYGEIYERDLGSGSPLKPAARREQFTRAWWRDHSFAFK